MMATSRQSEYDSVFVRVEHLVKSCQLLLSHLIVSLDKTEIALLLAWLRTSGLIYIIVTLAVTD